VSTGKYLPKFRKSYLTLSSGTSKKIVRDKHTHVQSQEISLPGSSSPRTVLLDSKYEGSALFRNVGKDKPSDTEYYS